MRTALLILPFPQINIIISLLTILSKVLAKEKATDEKADGPIKKYILKHKRSKLEEKFTEIIARNAGFAAAAGPDIKDEIILKLSGDVLGIAGNFFPEVFAPKAEEYTKIVVSTLVAHPPVRSMRLGVSEADNLIKRLNAFNGLKEDDTTFSKETKLQRISNGLFNTKKLESKAKALKELGGVIKDAEDGAKGALFTKKEICAWLKTAVVAKKHFSEGFLDYGHIDLARLNYPIIVFALDNDVLTERSDDTSIVSRLWEQSVGQHDSVKTCIYTTILQLFSHLPEEELAELAKKANEISEGDVDNPTLQFVSSLIIKYRTDKKTKGSSVDFFPLVELMWKAMFSQNKSLAEYAETCLRRMAGKLAGPENDSPLATKFRTFAVEELKKIVSEPAKTPNGLLRPFALLKDFTLLCFGKKGTKKIPSVAQVLSTSFPGLLDAILQDLVAYCKHAADLSSKGTGSGGTPAAALSSTYLDGTNSFKHNASVNNRLDCIKFVLENTPNGKGISGKNAVLLWNALSEVSPEDRERCVEWLLQTMADPEEIRCKVEDKIQCTCFFSVNATKEFFDKCLMKESDESFTQNSSLFTLFYRLFLLLNATTTTTTTTATAATTTTKSKKPVVCYKKQRGSTESGSTADMFFKESFYANLQNFPSDSESFEARSFEKLLSIVGAARGSSSFQGAEYIIRLVAKSKALSMSMRTNNFNIFLERFIEGRPKMISFALSFFSGLAKFSTEDLFDFTFSSCAPDEAAKSITEPLETVKDGKNKYPTKPTSTRGDVLEFIIKTDTNKDSEGTKSVFSNLKSKLTKAEKDKNIKVVWSREQQQQQQQQIGGGSFMGMQLQISYTQHKRPEPIVICVQAKKTDTVGAVKKKIAASILNNPNLTNFTGETFGFPIVPSDIVVMTKNGKPIGDNDDGSEDAQIGKYASPYYIKFNRVPRANFMDHIQLDTYNRDAPAQFPAKAGSSSLCAATPSSVATTLIITKKKDGASALGKETFEFLKGVFLKKRGEKDSCDTLANLISENLGSISEDEAISAARLLSKIYVLKRYAQEGTEKDGEEATSLDSIISSYASNKFTLLLKAVELCFDVFTATAATATASASEAGRKSKKQLLLNNEKSVVKFMVDDLAKSESKLDFLVFEVIALMFSRLGDKFKIGKKGAAFKLVQYFLRESQKPTAAYAGLRYSTAENIEGLALSNILRGSDVVLSLLGKGREEEEGEVSECFEPLLFSTRSRLIRAVTAERVKDVLLELGDSGKEYSERLHAFFTKKCVAAPYESIFDLYTALLRSGHPETVKRLCSESSILLLMDTVRAHESSESSTAPNGPDPDPVLNGILGVLTAVLEKDSALARSTVAKNREVFEAFVAADLVGDCLFNTPEIDGPTRAKNLPKCKCLKSRRAAFHLLETLAGLTLFEVVSGSLSRVVLGVEPGNLAALVKNADAVRRPQIGYLGLRNQGATCYMNSLLQQLYMNPSFKNFVLSIRDCPKTRNAEADEPDYDTVHQLQRLFAQLQESFGTYVDTLPFCKTVRDFCGMPIVLSQQMDANEFYNTLFDKIENVAKTLPCGVKPLKDNFQLTSVTQIVCEEDEEHVSEANEPCYTISVDIKNKKNIRDAIETYIRGETLSGDNQYFCSKCNKKVNALKKCYFKDLPQTLVVHLKRFEFHMDIMRNIKLNDYCEFPLELNMEEYCRNTLSTASDTDEEDNEDNNGVQKPPGYYDYRLTGVVVHSGTADGGHYYSYRRDNCPPYKRWLEFNDSRVTPFDPALIPKACFGGKTTVETKGTKSIGSESTTATTTTKEVDITHSAYILFYERVTGDIQPQFAPGRYVSECISKSLREEMWFENFRKIKVSNIFNDSFAEFVLSLTSHGIEDHKQEGEGDSDNDNTRKLYTLNAFKTILFMFCNVVVAFKGSGEISRWIECLRYYVNHSFCARKWFVDFITNNTKLFFDKAFFATSVPDKGRVELITLIVDSLSAFVKAEGKYLNSIDAASTDAKNSSLAPEKEEKEEKEDVKEDKKKTKKKERLENSDTAECEADDSKMEDPEDEAEKEVGKDNGRNTPSEKESKEKSTKKQEDLFSIFFEGDSDAVHWDENYDSEHISVVIPLIDAILALFPYVSKKWYYLASSSMFYLLLRCLVKSNPSIADFLVTRRDFITRGIQFYEGKLSVPMESPVGLIALDEDGDTPGKKAPAAASRYNYSSSSLNMNGLVETVVGLIKSRPLAERSGDDTAMFGAFVKELLSDSGDYAEYAADIAVYLCKGEKDMFKFFLRLYETETSSLTCVQSVVRTYEKFMGTLLRINDEHREWRAEVFVNLFVKGVKKMSSEFAAKKTSSHTIMSYLETFAHVYKAADRSLYTAFKSKQRDIDKLLRETGEFSLVFF